jgi:hypothetical protein
MPIDASVPKIVPAIEEAVFDKWVIKRIVIVQEGDSATAPVIVRAALCRARVDNKGEWHVNVNDRVMFEVPDLYAKAAQDIKWGMAMQTVIDLVKEEGEAQGVL